MPLLVIIYSLHQVNHILHDIFGDNGELGHLQRRLAYPSIKVLMDLADLSSSNDKCWQSDLRFLLNFQMSNIDLLTGRLWPCTQVGPNTNLN